MQISEDAKVKMTALLDELDEAAKMIGAEHDEAEGELADMSERAQESAKGLDLQDHIQLLATARDDLDQARASVEELLG